MSWLRTKFIIIGIVVCGVGAIAFDFGSVLLARIGDALFITGIFGGVYLLTSHKNKQMSEIRDANALLLLENRQQQEAIVALNKDINQLREQMTPATAQIAPSKAFKLFEGRKG